MRIGLLTDIHANRAALEAVLAALSEEGVETLAFLGDLVGYGPDPEACIALVAEKVGQGAVALRGNHDAAALGERESMNGVARLVADWTGARLTAEARAFLKSLPMSASLGPAYLTHASADEPGAWTYVTNPARAAAAFGATKAPLLFCGHVHRPALFSAEHNGMVRALPWRPGPEIPLLPSRRWLAVLGAVGQPRDGSPMAAYGIWDNARQSLSFRRVAYDVAGTVARLRAEGLPEVLAQRLMKGE